MIIINRREAGLDSGIPTKTETSFKAEAGTAPDTVFGAVNVVATETHLFPFQYSMMLALLKMGFEKLKSAETPEPKVPVFEEMRMS